MFSSSSFMVSGLMFTSLINFEFISVYGIRKKLEIELPYDPAIPLLGIHTEETRIERHVHPNVHRSTVYNSQDMEAT